MSNRNSLIGQGGRHLPVPPTRINKQDVYEYALRCVLLTTTAHNPPSPKQEATAIQKPSVPQPSTRASANFTESGTVRHSMKFPKELQKLVKKRLSAIKQGQVPQLAGGRNEQVLRFLILFGEYHMNERKFKDRMRDGTVADMLSYFLECVVVAGHRAPGSQAPFINGFVTVCGDTLRHEGSNFDNVAQMIRELEAFERLIAGPKQAPPPPRQVNTQSTAPSAKPIRDPEGLMDWLRHVMGVSQADHFAAVQRLHRGCDQQAAFDDLKLCLSALNQDVHPSAREADFADKEAYEAWKRKERSVLEGLILSMVKQDPTLAQRPTKDIPHAMHAPDGRNGGGYVSPYTFIPVNPRLYYKFVLSACLDAELKSGIADGKFLGAKSSGVLKELGLRWRLVPTFRLIATLDAMRLRYDEGVVTTEQVREALIQLERTIRRDAAGEGVGAERRYLFQAYMGLHRSMVMRLVQALEHLENTSHKDLGTVLMILDDVHEDPIFRAGYPELSGVMSQMKTTIQTAATARFSDFTEKSKEENAEDGEIFHLIDLAEFILTETKSTGKRFPELLLGEIDVAGLCLETFLRFFILKMEDFSTSQDTQSAEEDGRPTDELFRLYRITKVLYRMYVRSEITIEGVEFDICKWFLPLVLNWLKVTEGKTFEWVDGAIRVDTFQPISEEEDEKHSSSVLDLFACFQQQLDFLASLEWQNKEQHAQFMTQLSRVFSLAVVQYCAMMEDLFRADLAPVSTQQMATAPTSTSLLARVRGTAKPSKAAEPIHLKAETCVKLNNIEAVQYKLDVLYSDIDADLIAELNANAEDVTERKGAKQVYIYSIKIIQAEGLRAMDANGLSDPYVILTSGQLELARTRVVFETLDPRFDEVFEIPLDIPIIVRATVYDQDLVGQDEICGQATFQLQPALYNDYLPHDLWLDLDTQGRLLVRVSMEGERNDIRFYFGKAFRTLKRTQTDMGRMIIEQMSGYFKYCLSRDVLFKVLQTKNSGGFFRMSTPQHATLEECDEALASLIFYLDLNLATLFVHLQEDIGGMVFSLLWKEILAVFESLLVPPLSDRPSNMIPLDEYQLTMTYTCLEQLKTYFNGGADGEGVPMRTLENSKYRNLLAIQQYYVLPSNELIQAYLQAVEKEKQKKMTKRQKSVVNHISSRSIRKSKGRQGSEKGKGSAADEAECILRIMRMRKDLSKSLPEYMAIRTRKRYEDRDLPAIPQE